MAITSDKGLCGGINSSVCKFVRATTDLTGTEGEGPRASPQELVYCSGGEFLRHTPCLCSSQRHGVGFLGANGITRLAEARRIGAVSAQTGRRATWW